MNKKAFTLVELLATIVIIGIIALVVIPNIKRIINNAHQKAYDTQVNEIIAMAKKWASNNTDKLDKYHLNNTYITFTTLKEEGYMAKNKIENPKNEKIMIGCIEISYNYEMSSYDYKYLVGNSTGDSNYLNDEKNACNGKIGYIYTYDTNGALVENKDNVVTSAYDTILENNSNNIKVIGETETGLYDTLDEYLYKGSDVSNYVKFGDTTDLWRIISINKKEKTMKLIRNNSVATNAWDASKTDFENATISSVQLNDYYESSTSSISAFKDKINTKANLNLGSVDVVDNYENVRAKESSKVINYKIGLMNISDYLGASTTCESFDKTTCSTNNYLFNMINSSSTWTIDNNNNEIWYIATDGDILKTTPDKLYNIYPVITLNSNIKIKSGNGTNSSPYVIE